jgi:hypothetical protein
MKPSVPMRKDPGEAPSQPQEMKNQVEQVGRLQTFDECNALLKSEVERQIPSIVLANGVLNYLFQKSRVQWPRAEWQDAIREASATVAAMRVVRRNVNWESLMDVAAADEAFARRAIGSNAGGVLMLTFHGAFVVAAQQLLTTRCSNAAFLLPSQLMIGRTRKFDNPRDATFAALRLLQGGQVVLMAPDGPCGKQSWQLDIFGGSTWAGEGAAFLAHASKSNTAWYTVARRGERFAPVIEPGPTVAPNESLASFSKRLAKFYSSKVEEIFSGDPRNMSMMGHWNRRFREIIRPTPRAE